MLSRLLDLWRQGPEHVDQGCELLLALAEPSLLVALWESVSVLSPEPWAQELGAMVGWASWMNIDEQGRILNALISASPPGLLATLPIVSKIRRLHLSAPRTPQGPSDAAAMLDRLGCFPNLRTLSLHGMALSGLPAVRELTLVACSLSGPTWLPTALEILRLREAEAVLPHLRAVRTLEALEISETCLEGVTLHLPMESLDIRVQEGLPALHTVPDLRQLVISFATPSPSPLRFPPIPETVEELGCTAREDILLDALAHHPRLRVLLLSLATLTSLAPLSTIPSLRLVRLGTVGDLTPLAQLPHLRRLEIGVLASQTIPPTLEPWLVVNGEEDDIPF